MTTAEYKAQIGSGISTLAINALVDQLAQTCAERDELKAKVSELEKAATPAAQ